MTTALQNLVLDKFEELQKEVDAINGESKDSAQIPRIAKKWNEFIEKNLAKKFLTLEILQRSEIRCRGWKFTFPVSAKEKNEFADFAAAVFEEKLKWIGREAVDKFSQQKKSPFKE